MRRVVVRSIGWAVALAALVGCGSDEGGDTPVTAAGGGGQGGGAGASAGKGGAGSGGSGQGGGGGASAGKGGAGGASGKGGAGAAGKGGASGSGGGEAGSGGGCQASSECVLPDTVNPKGCAEAACEAGVCVFRARDKDGDGKRAKLCKDPSGEVTIEAGNDCDDGDPARFPGAWDGPEGEGHASACDGVDNDCSGTPDDSVLSDGTSCECKPGAVAQCSQDSSGKPITWPKGAPVGACKYGNKTCVADAVTGLGAWGPCTDAVPPQPEICDTVDNDCDGLKDDEDSDVEAATWYCDADNDDEVSPDAVGLKRCASPPPEQCGASANAKWATALPKTDCDDSRVDINKKSPEVCDDASKSPDGKAHDENCDGQINEGCKCADGETQPCFKDPNGVDIPSAGGVAVGECQAGTQTCKGGVWAECLEGKGPAAEVCANEGKDNDCNGDTTEATDQESWFCDGDNDGFAAVDAQPVKSCGPPTLPCAGPTPVWKTNLPTKDCADDRPDINPNAAEVCDGGQDDPDKTTDDEDCNGVPNEGCGCTNGATQPCFVDPNGKPIPQSSGVAIGECKAGSQLCQGGQWGPCLGGLGVAIELCANEGQDNDCDGDPNDSEDQFTFYCDTDSDGFLDKKPEQVKTIQLCAGAPAPGTNGCAGVWRASGTPFSDCLEGNATINPSAPEICEANLVDENCNGASNEGCDCVNGTSQPCFQDPNGNLIPNVGGVPIGTCKVGSQACVAGKWGSCLNGQGPSAEVCDTLDNDCDGLTDENVTSTYYCDPDNDGFLSTNQAAVLSKTVCGAAPAAGSNGCAGTWRPQGTSFTDCAEGNQNISPNAAEICDGGPSDPDGKADDENCNSQVNEGCGCTNGSSQVCWTDPNGNPIPHTNNTPIGTCKAGSQACSGGQWGPCLNGQGAVTETCDGKDNDCDGQVDDGVLPTWLCDLDGDGFGDKNKAPVQSCSQPVSGCTSGTNKWTSSIPSTKNTDCNDSALDVSPGAPEVCSNLGIDNNCNGDTTEATDKPTFYCDPDSDGYLSTNQASVLTTTAFCTAPATGTNGCAGAWRASGTPFTDCNPTNATVYPNAPELCTSTDENCNGSAYDGWSWPNGQGFGAACNNGLAGSCNKTGTNYCASSNSAACNAGTWPGLPYGANTFTTTAVNGSYDVSCDNKLEYDKLVPNANVLCYTKSAGTCATAGCFPGQTYWLISSASNHQVTSSDVVPVGAKFDVAYGNALPNCGSTVTQTFCIWNGSSYEPNVTATPKQGCR